MISIPAKDSEAFKNAHEYLIKKYSIKTVADSMKYFKEEFGVYIFYDDFWVEKTLNFRSEEDATMFMLKWS